jgi:hypothetical protein
VVIYYFFYCELNPIENYWGYGKAALRKICGYNIQALEVNAPAVFNDMPTITIRKFYRKCWRYMDAYRRGLPFKLAEYAV